MTATQSTEREHQERLAQLLETHGEAITARWQEHGAVGIPITPGLEESPDPGVRPFCAVLRALIYRLRASRSERVQYMTTLLSRWHANGIVGDAADLYFDWLRDALREVLTDLGLAGGEADAIGILFRELGALRVEISNLESAVLHAQRAELQMHLDALLERVPEAILLIEPGEGLIRAANATAAELTGHPEARLRGLTLSDLFPELSDVPLRAMMAEAADTGHASRRDLELHAGDGARLRVNLDLTFMRSGSRPLAMALLDHPESAEAGRAALRNLTRDLRAEVDARVAQIDRLRAFFENVISALPIRILVLDSELRVIHANRAYYAERGLNKEQVVGRPIDEVMSEQTLQKAGLQAALLSVLETGHPVRWSGHRSASTPRDRVVNIRVDPCEGPDGDRIILLTLEDITERQRQLYERAILQQIAHALLGQLELPRLLHAILTGMTAGGAVGLGFNRAFLLLVDEEEAVLQGQMGVGPENLEQALQIWSEVAEDHHTLQDFLAEYDRAPSRAQEPLRELVSQLRFPMDELDQLPMAAIVAHQTVHVLAAEVDERVPQKMRDLLGTSEFVVAPLVAREKVIGAAIADNKFTDQPISQASVQLLTALADQAALAIDSARAYQRAREDAQRLDEALTELKAAQAQRLQSAKLAAIGEVTAIVAHEIRSPLSTIGGFARSIARQPDRLERNARNAQIIVEEVERLERILGDLLDFSKPSEPELSMIQLGPILESVAESIRYDARAEDVQVQLDLAENVPDVLADPKQVRQILQNLVNNALEAMQQAGTLTLGLAERNGAVEMYVQDTGEGIPVERMEQIFDTFYTSKPTGTGLGLALCKKLVAQHGGELLVESEEGRGARFTVSFPHPTETERALRPEDEI